MTAPAIGYSIVANLGGDRQITIQCFVGEDEADDAVNARMDRAFRVVDRQKAKYELVDLRDELIKKQETLAQFHEDKARIDHDIDVKLAMLDVQVGVGNDTLTAMNNDAYEAHVKTGRQGEFRAAGATKANMERVKQGLAQIQEQRDKIVAERNQHHESVMISITRYEAAIAADEAKIAAREALLG